MLLCILSLQPSRKQLEVELEVEVGVQRRCKRPLQLLGLWAGHCITCPDEGGVSITWPDVARAAGYFL